MKDQDKAISGLLMSVVNDIHSLNLDIQIENFDKSDTVIYQLDIADRNIGKPDGEKCFDAFAIPGHGSYPRSYYESDYIIIPTYNIFIEATDPDPVKAAKQAKRKLSMEIMSDLGKILSIKAEYPKHEIVMPIRLDRSYMHHADKYTAHTIINLGIGLI